MNKKLFFYKDTFSYKKVGVTILNNEIMMIKIAHFRHQYIASLRFKKKALDHWSKAFHTWVRVSLRSH